MDRSVPASLSPEEIIAPAKAERRLYSFHISSADVDLLLLILGLTFVVSSKTMTLSATVNRCNIEAF